MPFTLLEMASGTIDGAGKSGKGTRATEECAKWRSWKCVVAWRVRAEDGEIGRPLPRSVTGKRGVPIIQLLYRHRMCEKIQIQRDSTTRARRGERNMLPVSHHSRVLCCYPDRETFRFRRRGSGPGGGRPGSRRSAGHLFSPKTRRAW